MAFGNPYGDPWDETKIGEALNKLVGLGVQSVSLADTVGMAGPDLIRSVFEALTSQYPRLRHRRAPAQRARAS